MPAFSCNIFADMKKTADTKECAISDLEMPEAYERMRQALSQTGWICQGTVVCRSLLRQINGKQVEKGPYYLWTCKVQGKTVCVSLSKAQYDLIKEAIENNRQMQNIIEQMQSLTMKTILKKVSGVKKRK